MNNWESSETGTEDMQRSEPFTHRGTKRKIEEDRLDNQTPVQEINHEAAFQITAEEKFEPSEISNKHFETTCKDIKRRNPEGGWVWAHWIKTPIRSLFWMARWQY